MNRKAVLLLLILVGAVLVAVWALRDGAGIPPAESVGAGDEPRAAIPPAAAEVPPADRTPVAEPVQAQSFVSIRGRVLWPDGVPVSGAEIRRDTEREVARARSRFPDWRSTPGGNFQITVERPFEGDLVARLGHLRTPSVHVDARSADVTGVVLRFEALPNLRGVLVDPRGRAVRGEVRFVVRTDGVDGEGAIQALSTDGHGLFRIVADPGQRIGLVGTATGFARSGVVWIAIPQGGTGVTVALVDLLDIVGEVVRPDGSPWVGLSVFALDLREHLVEDGVGVSDAKTDAEGRFVLGGVPAIADLELLIARRPSAQVHVRREIDPRIDPVRLVVTEEELRAVALDVDVVGADGRRVERFVAMAFRRGDGGDWWPAAVSGTAAGVARLEDLPPGIEIAVTVKIGERTAALHRQLWSGGVHPLTVRVEAAGALEIRAAGAEWVTVSGPGTFPAGATLQPEQGVVRLPALAPGDYVVRTEGSGEPAREVRATVLPGRTVVVDLPDGR